MKWKRCKLYSHDCIISGIYKIVTPRPGEYHAFYIRHSYRNWGDYVAPPPDRGRDNRPCWLSLDEAKRACEEHAKTHKPSASALRVAQRQAERAEVLT